MRFKKLPDHEGTAMVNNFQRLMDRSNPALVVVTAAHGSQMDGCVVGFHCQAGMEPPRYAVWLSRVNRTYEIAVAASTLGVHFLSASDQPLAQHFGSQTGDEVDKFTDLEWHRGPDGVPLLQQCSHRLVLERHVVVDAASNDHICWLGTVVDVAAPGSVDAEFELLRLQAGDSISPGHPIADPPKI